MGMRLFDVVIVGAGPIGLSTAVALQRSGIDSVVLDAGPIGQTMSWWAPETRWFSSNERISIAGVPLLTSDQTKATREDYLTYLRAIVGQFDLDVRTYHRVDDIRPAHTATADQPTLEVIARANQTDVSFFARRVVLAIGGTDHPADLGVPGEGLPHVDGYLREPHRYCGRRVLIIGGRNSAIEAALRLHHAGASVTLCHRGADLPRQSIKYWLMPEFDALAKAGRITTFFSRRVVRITPQAVELAPADLGDPKPSEVVRVLADDVLKLIGYRQDKSLLLRAGVELIDDNQRPHYDEATMRTNVPGVYVAGTAVAGTQSSSYRIFLENCHRHVAKIVADLTGVAAAEATAPYQSQIASGPES